MPVRVVAGAGLLCITALAFVAVAASGQPDARKPAKSAPGKEAVQARTITLNEKAAPLSEALKQLTQQTGTALEDRRDDRSNDPKLRLKLDKATFWQAVDAIAKEADLRVQLDPREGKVALVGGPYREMPASYDGIFRVTLRRLMMVRQFDAGEEGNAQYCVAHLQIDWEPRFQPFLISSQPEGLVVQDDKGRKLDTSDRDRGRAPINSKLSVMDLQVHLPAPPRSAAKFAVLKGTFNIFGAGKMLTFTFAKLDDKKAQSKTEEGVTVKLSEVKTDEEPWTAGFALKYPGDDQKLESFQSYLVNNEAFLEDKAGKRWAANGGSEIDQNQLTTRHFWVEDGKLKLGKPGDWKLVYRTPGQMTELPVKFEFKDVPLP